MYRAYPLTYPYHLRMVSVLIVVSSTHQLILAVLYRLIFMANEVRSIRNTGFYNIFFSPIAYYFIFSKKALIAFIFLDPQCHILPVKVIFILCVILESNQAFCLLIISWCTMEAMCPPLNFHLSRINIFILTHYFGNSLILVCNHLL